MKKFLLALAVTLSVFGANAQSFKSMGIKVIGELGLDIEWATGKGVKGSYFGMITPGIDISVGKNVMPQLFLGGGLGYDIKNGVRHFSVFSSAHEVKFFGHGRYYFEPAGSNLIADLKLGYKRNVTAESNAFEMFIGPGYMFSNKYAVSLGYNGSFYNGSSAHGLSFNFSVEF